MNGQETLAALTEIADKLELLAAEAGFENDEAYGIEDAWNVVQEAVYSVDQTLQGRFEIAFLERIKTNPAPKLDVTTFPI